MRPVQPLKAFHVGSAMRVYYGNDMYINSAESIAGVPSSWPGYDLTIGSSGDKVRQMQQQLNRIARNYPAIQMFLPRIHFWS